MHRLTWMLPIGLLVAVIVSSRTVSSQTAGSPSPAPAAAEPQAAPAQSGAAAAPPLRRVGTMSELMIKMIYPTSDAIFYIETRQPKNEVEWGELENKTLVLTESANLLMLPGRARDQDRWMADSKLMLDAGMAAFAAAKKRDLPALIDLNDQLYVSCTTCHQHYRPNYGRRPTPPQ